MQSKRIYKCLQNEVTGDVEITITDESGSSISRAVFDNWDETVAYFFEIRDELVKNTQLEITHIDDFHFESKTRQTLSVKNDKFE
jgi:hypothetical protein